MIKKLPETDEDIIKALQIIINQEEMSRSEDKALSMEEIHNMRLFLFSFEGACFVFRQTENDEQKSQGIYDNYFNNAHMYVSHFIQVLQFTVMRKEMKMEVLSHYGFEKGKELVLPDLSTEDALLEWGAKIIEGERQRIYNGGIPLYNPAIAKVKVHYDIFKDNIHSLKVYKQNTCRSEDKMLGMRTKALEIIKKAWGEIEDKYKHLPYEVYASKLKAYGIQFSPQKGDQLSVFD